MVMEAQPSPRAVGNEFVRQYYTLLNQAPEHLHRFYSNNSFYVHGGADDRDPDLSLAVGQKQIHQRIEQLNFKDCHAKIAQVDSQATLGNGVVVQVSGELSNGGQPMRRFTQTFVLASQSPTKYYVHNDIFRYQDVFDEEVEQGSGRSETEEEPDHNQVADIQSQQQQQNQLPNSFYGGGSVPPATVNGGGAHHDEPPSSAPAPATHGLPPPNLIQPMQTAAYMPPSVDYMQQQSAAQQPAMELQQQPTAVAAAAAQPPPMSAATAQDMYAAAEQPAAEDSHAVDEEDVGEEDEVAAAANEEAESKHHLDNYPSLEQQSELGGQSHETAQSNEPKTYATLVKSGTSGLNTSPQAPTKAPSSPPPGIRMESRSNEPSSMGGGGRGPMGGAPRGRGGSAIRGMGDRGAGGRGALDRDRNSAPPRPTHNDDSGNFGGDYEKRRTGSYMHPDAHQLFLGNLPPAATEDDLREMFSKFGTILDLKIMSKTTIKGPNNAIKPNYGFIVFEDQEAVNATLDKRPFNFAGVKLNVEEKRARNSRGPPMEGGGGRMSSGGGDLGGGGGRGSRGGMPGGMRGGGGNNRSYVSNRGGGGGYMRGGGSMRTNGAFNSRAPNNR